MHPVTIVGLMFARTRILDYGPVPLQRNDAWFAENIINRLTNTNKGIACLPVHDSFIVAKIYESELLSVMEDIFYNTFSIKPNIK